ncbi:hypothetical protein [Pedobacter sp. UBA4863]|uniref:hypothetical protein n=1 Tax=Pedobacter sp. UBA4863 TaxID=1947060 RepID=UPI0025F81C50|nr:hypothetical protein [Pedobacter sp. UBA4863]
MSNKERKVALYPSNLSPFTSGTDYANYKLYNLIKQQYNLLKGVRLTTFHVAKFYKKNQAEIEEIIFGWPAAPKKKKKKKKPENT